MNRKIEASVLVLAGAAFVSGCEGPAPADVNAIPEHSAQHYRVSDNIPTLLGGGSGFTCYTDNFPEVLPFGDDKLLVTLKDATCENNNPRMYHTLQEMGVTPNQATEIIVFSDEADRIKVVSQ